MDQRKKEEVEYYNRKVREQIKSGKEGGDFEGFDPFALESYDFLRKICQDKCRDKKILDYGCGNGIHCEWLEKISQKVVGIDLSQESLRIAEQRAGRIEFLLMDCENLNFSDSSFDVIFDGGTFSSLDLNRVLPEITRVLRPNGFLIGIETFGHNPLINLKRKINKIIGKRTVWATSHIFKMKDLKLVEKYFEKIEVHFFHLVSWLAIPFLKFPGGKFLLRAFEKIDHILLFFLPFLKKYSFKIVFIFFLPKKYDGF